MSPYVPVAKELGQKRVFTQVFMFDWASTILGCNENYDLRKGDFSNPFTAIYQAH